MISRCWSRL